MIYPRNVVSWTDVTLYCFERAAATSCASLEVTYRAANRTNRLSNEKAGIFLN